MKQTGLWKALYLTHRADKMTDAARMALQQSRLRELIAYAKENSPYFSALYREVNEDTPLDTLPVTNKAEMTEHFDAWMTDRAITRKKVDAFKRGQKAGRQIPGLHNLRLNGNALHHPLRRYHIPCVLGHRSAAELCKETGYETLYPSGWKDRRAVCGQWLLLGLRLCQV